MGQSKDAKEPATELAELSEPKGGKSPLPNDVKDSPGLQRAIQRYQQAPNVSAEMTSEGQAKLTIGEKSSADECARLMVALGLADNLMFSPFLGQIGNSVSSNGEMSETAMQFAIGFVKSVEPENETEALLAAQMAAVHVCAMDASRRLLASSSLQAKDSAERALTKLTRTFATQMDTLKRYRAKAQQVVRVERVTVNGGGQAIVGAVKTGGRGDEKKWR